MKYLLGEATAVEQEQVQEWLHAEPGNTAYYNELKKVWDRSRQLVSKSTVDENKAWEKFRHRIHPEIKAPSSHRIGWRRIAAAVILLIGLSVAGYWLLNRPEKEVIVEAAETAVTDTLPDKSVITVNKRSSISYPSAFKGDTRTVKLQGEAFFNVTPDKKKPFIVYVNDVKITVVGTSFNVKTKNGKVEVIVESGIVRVEKGNEVEELRADQKVTLAKDSAAVTETVTDRLYNYYRTREFVCDNTPFWKLVEVLNEAYGVNIVIAREDKKYEPIDVPFYNESLDQVLKVICETMGVTKVIEGDKIILQ